MGAECSRIADLLDRAYRGDAWHGPCVLESLADIDAEMANCRLDDESHSIWELTSHILAWGEEISRRLGGETPREMVDTLDWPSDDDSTGDGWMRLQERLAESHERLVGRLRGLSDERLDQDLALCSPSKIYVVLHGVIHHHLYHAGQVQMMKRIFQRQA